MRAIAFFDGVRGYLAIQDEATGVVEVVTTPAYPGHVIRIDDGRQYPQLFEGGRRYGRSLQWAHHTTLMGQAFARDCGARLYKKRAGYEGGFARMNCDAD
jgi:hypothetical protein